MSVLRRIRLPGRVEFSLRVPSGAELLFARIDGKRDAAYLYLLADPSESYEERHFVRVRKIDRQPLPSPTRFCKLISEFEKTLLFEVPPPAPEPANGGTSA